MNAPLFTFIALFASINAAVLKDGRIVPTYSTPCQRSRPDFDDCMKETIQEVIAKVSSTGIKEVNLPTFDPLFVPELITTYGSKGFNFKTSVKDVYNHGFGSTKITGFRSNFDDEDDILMEIDFLIPETFVTGRYKAEGLVADIPINGKGDFALNITRLSGTFKMYGHLITKQGEEYLKLHKIGLRPKVGGMAIQSDNLVDGNPELSQIALTFFNQFWQVIYYQMLPYAEEGFDKVFKGYINKAFLQIPFEQLIPK